MDKVGVAICSREPEKWRGREQFSGYIFDADDNDSRVKAEEWARRYENKYDSKKETIVYEPNVHTFDNKGFIVTILDSAGGSSQGGRLSFWKCRVEKDGVEFIVGVNDSILADLIRNSDMKNGRVTEGVMFARRGGQPGFIHEGMEAYKEAMADMQQKANLKKAKKTSKWEIGGVYSTLTQTDICIGEVWDTMEEYSIETRQPWSYNRRETRWRKLDKPVKVFAWIHFYDSNSDKEPIKDLAELLRKELDSSYIHFYTGKPPARHKVRQLEVKKSDLKLIDQLLAKKREYNSFYAESNVTGRYVREIKS